MNPLLLRALLAALPLLGLASKPWPGVVYGAFGFGIFLVATLIFLGIHFAIPQTLHRLSFFLLLLVFGVIGSELFSVSPLLLAGLFFLPLPELFRRRKKWDPILRKTLLVGFSFGVILAGHGILTNLLGVGGRVPLFQLPAGSYLILGLALAFLKIR